MSPLHQLEAVAFASGTGEEAASRLTGFNRANVNELTGRSTALCMRPMQRLAEVSARDLCAKLGKELGPLRVAAARCTASAMMRDIAKLCAELDSVELCCMGTPPCQAAQKARALWAQLLAAVAAMGRPVQSDGAKEGSVKPQATLELSTWSSTMSSSLALRMSNELCASVRRNAAWL